MMRDREVQVMSRASDEDAVTKWERELRDTLGVVLDVVPEEERLWD